MIENTNTVPGDAVEALTCPEHKFKSMQKYDKV